MKKEKNTIKLPTKQLPFNARGFIRDAKKLYELNKKEEKKIYKLIESADRKLCAEKT